MFADDVNRKPLARFILVSLSSLFPILLLLLLLSSLKISLCLFNMQEADSR